jgi:hypothetical protein
MKTLRVLFVIFSLGFGTLAFGDPKPVVKPPKATAPPAKPVSTKRAPTAGLGGATTGNAKHSTAVIDGKTIKRKP